MMRRTLVAFVLALGAAAFASAQTNADAARAELYEGARLYRAGQYVEAERHFRRALELDPEGKNTRVFIARAIQQQYKPGDPSPENVAQAERAIEAYTVLLTDERHRDDAYKATVFLNTQLNRFDRVEALIRQRGEDTAVEDEKRAEAFIILASRRWQCSYDITESKSNKRAGAGRDRAAAVRYRMPADPADFERASGCVEDGLRLSERAAGLDPGNPNLWSYKAVLFREKAKLAEMRGDPKGRDEYERIYEYCLEMQRRLTPRSAATAGRPED